MSAAATAPGSLTAHVRWGRVAAVVNPASGSVSRGAAEQMTAIAARYGLDLKPQVAEPSDIRSTLEAAVRERPDVLIVLAGDGTLAESAALCGADGPLLAALPGGTMNMLPHALNGRRSWPEALEAILERGQVLEVSGGEVGGHSFYVAAILGAPALWADAREAVRKGKLGLAILRARRALLRAFKGRLRFCLDDGERRKAEALTLMCPLVSRGLDADVGLEAAALDPKGALEGFRLGLSTLVGSWRKDPAVKVEVCTRGEVAAKGRIPTILDGEPHRLEGPVHIAYRPVAFRAVVPDDCTALKERAHISRKAERETAQGAAVNDVAGAVR